MQLAYGGPADMFDEYLRMGEATSLQVLRQFCRGIKAVFGGEISESRPQATARYYFKYTGGSTVFLG